MYESNVRILKSFQVELVATTVQIVEDNDFIVRPGFSDMYREVRAQESNTASNDKSIHPV